MKKQMALKINGAVVIKDTKDVTINGEKGIKFGDFNREYKYFTYVNKGDDDQESENYIPLVSKDGVNWVLPVSIEVSPFAMIDILRDLEIKEGE